MKNTLSMKHDAKKPATSMEIHFVVGLLQMVIATVKRDTPVLQLMECAYVPTVFPVACECHPQQVSGDIFYMKMESALEQGKNNFRNMRKKTKRAT